MGSLCAQLYCAALSLGDIHIVHILEIQSLDVPKEMGIPRNLSFTYLDIKSFLILTLNFKTLFLNVPFLLSIELLLVNKAQLQQSSGAARTYLEASMYTILRLYPFNVQILQ